MKKILTVGLLAICAIAFTQQQASAWVNSRFGVGMNWDFQGGGNQLAWGLWRSNQPGGADPTNAGLFEKHHQRWGCPGFNTPPAAPTPHMAPPPAHAPAYAPAMPTTAPHQFGPMHDPSVVQQVPYGVPYQFATYSRTGFYPTPYRGR